MTNVLEISSPPTFSPVQSIYCHKNQGIVGKLPNKSPNERSGAYLISLIMSIHRTICIIYILTKEIRHRIYSFPRVFFFFPSMVKTEVIQKNDVQESESEQNRFYLKMETDRLHDLSFRLCFLISFRSISSFFSLFLSFSRIHFFFFCLFEIINEFIN